LPPLDAAIASGYIFAPVDVSCYTELINAIRSRVGELGIRYQDFDSLADFAAGLTGKVFGQSQIKRLGPEKLFDALRAASLKIRIEPDEEQLRRMQKSMAENCQPRQAKQARMNNHSHLSNKMINGVLDYLANKKGGLARLNKAVKQARANHARRTIATGVNWAQKRSLQHINGIAGASPRSSGQTQGQQICVTGRCIGGASSPPPTRCRDEQSCSSQQVHLCNGKLSPR
jgi:ferritin-like metal-binding protein YciE